MGISHNIDKVAWSSSQLLVLMSCGYFRIDKTMERCCQIIFLPISLAHSWPWCSINETKCRTARQFDSSLAEQSELYIGWQSASEKKPLICFYQGVGTLSFLKPIMLSCMYNFLLVFSIIIYSVGLTRKIKCIDCLEQHLPYPTSTMNTVLKGCPR